MIKSGLAIFIAACVFLTATQAFAEKVPTPNEPPKGVKLATAQDLMDVFHAGGDVYDVRWHYSEYEFEGHIPFAKCVPFSEWSSKDLNFDISEDSWDYSVLPKDKNTPIAFYCMGVNCWKSYKLTAEVAKRGYKNVYWYKEGQPIWDKLNLPVVNNNPTYRPMQKIFSSNNNPSNWLVKPEELKQWFDSKEKLKVIDLRDEKTFLKGRLETAYQVPLEQLLSRDGIQLMPKPQLGFKIVLVSENGTLAAASAVPLSALGYDVKILSGGMKAWSEKYGDENSVDGPMEVNWPGKKGWKAQNFKLPKNR